MKTIPALRPLAALAVTVAVATWPGSRPARADSLDPNVPSVVVVGAPRGAATQARLDAKRTGLSSTSLPEAPTELWRRSLGTLEVAPLVDASGAITLALASAEIVKLGAGGKEIWRTRMQGGGPASAPIRLSDGTLGVVSTGGFFVGVGDRGRIRFSTPLGARGPDLVAPPAPLDDGGAAIVTGRSLVTIDADGRLTTETLLSAHVSSTPLVTDDGILVVGDDGSVMRIRPPRQAQKIGSFQVMLDGGAVLADERTLLGVTRDRLLALDLKTGIVSVRASTGSFATIDGPVVVARDHSAFFTTSDGLLFGVDASGQEIARATVERVTPQQPPPGMGPGYPPGAYPPGGYPGQVVRQSPPLLIDANGRIAFVRATGRFGISVGSAVAKPAASDGSKSATEAGRVGVDVVTERVCTTPLAVVPAGDERVLVVCREGLVALYGK